MSVVFIAASVPWLMNSMLAVYSVDKLLIDAGKTLGATDRKILTRIVCRTALPTLVAAEILAATAGLGYVAVNASQLLDTDVLIVAMIMIGILGSALTALIETSQRVLERIPKCWNRPLPRPTTRSISPYRVVGRGRGLVPIPSNRDALQWFDPNRTFSAVWKS